MNICTGLLQMLIKSCCAQALQESRLVLLRAVSGLARQKATVTTCPYPQNKRPFLL